MDERIIKLAKTLVGYSCNVKQGEKVLIKAIGAPDDLVIALVREVYARGGYPFVERDSLRVNRELIMGSDEKYAELKRDIDLAFMKQMDAYIAIRGGNNSFELSDVPAEVLGGYNKIMRPVTDERVNNTKWVILRYPTEGMSQQAKMSTEAYEKFFFDVCTMDYAKMDAAMDALKELMEKTDKVRIVAEDTDLTFSIKGIGAMKCSGGCNIPDGEVYSAPVLDSVNGYIHYNAPSIENGFEFRDVRLTFKDGKIIDATANDNKRVNEIFDTDDGARYVGEFAIGVNPYINHPIGDILFDEKIAGSIHFTPGCSYDDVGNGNQSAIHWDLVQIHTPEYGGGQIWFDDVLIRENGRFVIPNLEDLNPENLK